MAELFGFVAFKKKRKNKKASLKNKAFYIREIGS